MEGEFKSYVKEQEMESQIQEVIQIITMVTMFGITTGFSLSAYWNIKYLLKEKNSPFAWIKKNLAIASIAMVFTYIYLFIQVFLGEPISISPFSNLVIRPVILYLSFTIASAARANYTYITRRDKDG